ncbi:MAG TPA: class I SAM-dependent methyltransferase [Bryobacteraceae bacterium]|jgi:ubiquinone/menaquinone biosynthesis C-methylase UbiE
MSKLESVGVSGAARDPVVEFFDKRADDYDREYDGETPGGYALRVRRRIVLELFDQPGGKVLDLGCGPGVMADSLADRGCKFVGLDPSSKMLGIGRRRFQDREGIHFLAGEATRVALSDKAFDAVICMGVIDALKDGRLAVSEMLRVLKPGGTLIVTFTNLVSPYAWWKNYILYPAATQWHRLRNGGQIEKLGGRTLYTHPSAHGLLRSQGAEIIRTVNHYYNIFLSPLDEILPSAALRITKKLEDREWPRPDWIAAGFIVKARKV